MPHASSPPSPPATHTASTNRRSSLPSVPILPRASDGGITDPELERRWASVKAKLSAVLNEVRRTKQPVRTEPRHWVDMYSDVASLYTQDDQLRKRRMYVYVRQFVRDLVATQLTHLQGLDGPHLLAEYCRTWRASLTFVNFMKRVLHHLHRYWIKDNANTLKEDPVRPLDKLLMFYWREDLLSNLHSVIDIALELVNKDRCGESIDHSVVRGVVDTLVEVGAADIATPDTDSAAVGNDTSTSLSKLHLYIRVFEDDFLALTRSFYEEEGRKMVAIGDVTLFMKNVLARLDEEDERGRRLLHPDSSKRLRQATEAQLIGNHKGYLQREATEMVKAGREEDLKLLYTLLSRVENGLNPLRSFFVGYVREEGNSVVVKHVDKMAGRDDMESNLGLIRVLVQLYRKHASLIKRCFNGSQVIMLGVDDAFRGFANRSLGAISLPNLMAHYIDHLLRIGRSFDRKMWDIPVEDWAKRFDGACQPVDGINNVNSTSAAAPESPSRERPRKRQKTDNNTSKDSSGDEAKKDGEDGAISNYMSELVRLFMFLDDKDLFFETHRRLFAKRLLATHDEDLEELFIEKLKVEMGPTYTQRLSGMLKDKLVSNTLRSDFVKYLGKKREERAQFLREKAAIEDSARSAAIIALTTMREDRPEKRDSLLDRSTLERLFLKTLERVSERNKDDSQNDRENVTGTANGVSSDAAASSQPRTETNESENASNTKDKEAEVSKIDVSDAHIAEALKIDFNSHVLNALHWPSVKVADLHMPPILGACQKLFSDFYMTDKETRKLSWIHTLSTVHLTANFGSRVHTLVVSTFQACALLLFNERNRISVGDACVELNISKKELHQHIKPLLIGKKCKLLRLERRPAEEEEKTELESEKASERGKGGEAARVNPTQADPPMQGKGNGNGGTDVSATSAQRTAENGTNDNTSKRQADTIGTTEGANSSVDDSQAKNESSDNIETRANENGETQRKTEDGGNESESEEEDALDNNDIIHLKQDFKSKHHRVVVPASITKLASAEAAVSKRNVVVDRTTQIDAALVRILKAKKEIVYADLTTLVVDALTGMFLPDPRMIKSRLERLIDQEYVERDAEDARLYRYTA